MGMDLQKVDPWPVLCYEKERSTDSSNTHRSTDCWNPHRDSNSHKRDYSSHNLWPVLCGTSIPLYVTEYSLREYSVNLISLKDALIILVRRNDQYLFRNLQPLHEHVQHAINELQKRRNLNRNVNMLTKSVD